MPTAWHVLRTRTAAELAVAEALSPAAYVPLREVWRPHRLRRMRRVTAGQAPLIPAYVFLASPVASWAVVLAVPDVRGVLLCDGSPAVVADAELAGLRGAARRPALAAGAVVDIEAGVLAGQRVTVRAVDSRRMTIATDIAMLGSLRPVTVPIAALAA